MARRPRRPPPGKVIKGRLVLDPESVRALEQALLRLKEAARADVIDHALHAGAVVAQNAQKRRAPGPHIEVEFVKNVGSLTKGTASGLIKKGLTGNARYIAVGPDKTHWYYKMHDSGTKAHGVSKRKRTRRQQAGYAAGLKRREVNRITRGTRPMLSWVQDGRRVFARQVRGIPARPFVKPSIDDNQAAINAAMMQVLRDEIEKATK